MRKLFLTIVICLGLLSSYAQRGTDSSKDIIRSLQLTEQQIIGFKNILREHRDSVLRLSKITSIGYRERREQLDRLSLLKAKRLDSLLSPAQLSKLKAHYLTITKTIKPVVQQK